MEAWDCLGLCIAKKGEYKRAKKCFKFVLKMGKLNDKSNYKNKGKSKGKNKGKSMETSLYYVICDSDEKSFVLTVFGIQKEA
ncbi:hypothetical protein H5410_005985, partial [Solanum commersonii]